MNTLCRLCEGSLNQKKEKRPPQASGKKADSPLPYWLIPKEASLRELL